MSEPIAILVACPPGEPADALARGLVEGGLAACVNRLPGMRSTYRWKGETVTEDEDLLLVKTVRGAFAAVEAFVLANHPYEVPEIVALPLVEGHAPYLAWLESAVGASQSGNARS
ncbi:divalent-cation tolerance protein CutA [Luteibacter yeojuensis]|uniref:Divalent-cation tolerance protein CutA n=1 Tax=Luteibacter yeojuensis TaxID=345309 RepID=A0A7X5QVF0_9GAMM|nr:divalent-cation tolerance protein CutA [Luteibacter yeojuensis]NID16049.1 divalent-cation tolerance protein CutA [Luteibacter yeojuensis]